MAWGPLRKLIAVARGFFGGEKVVVIGRPQAVTAFARIGASDGKTGDLKGSLQAGLSLEPALTSRPDSALSFGVSHLVFSDGYLDNGRDAGLDLSGSETVWELTYSDLITDHIRLQPDIQYVRRPSGDHSIKDAVVVGLRLSIEL